MSLLDSDAKVLKRVDDYIKKQALTELFYYNLLGANVTAIETDINPIWKKISQTWHENEGSSMFVSYLVDCLKIDNSPFYHPLKKELGRPIYSIDCRYLCKFDVIGWLEEVAKLPLSQKPILVIENITELPTEDAYHDNPKYVQNLLIHSWKNPQNDFYNAHSGNSFSIIPENYTIFITWTPENRQKLDKIWNPSDGIAWIGNIDEDYQRFLTEYKDCSVSNLEKQNIISYNNN
ncbi:MAG: hypothetical protein IJS05_02490 [Paludibacteraceae bacterium]|nr:hypothetical protein [Paludibacteraceae bacterium]